MSMQEMVDSLLLVRRGRPSSISSTVDLSDSAVRFMKSEKC